MLVYVNKTILKEATTKKDIHKKHRLFSTLSCLDGMAWRVPAILLPAWGWCLHNKKGRITKITKKPKGTLAAANPAHLVMWCDELFTAFWVTVFVDILQQSCTLIPKEFHIGKQLLKKTSEVLDGQAQADPPGMSPRSCKADPLLELLFCPPLSGGWDTGSHPGND